MWEIPSYRAFPPLVRDASVTRRRAGEMMIGASSDTEPPWHSRAWRLRTGLSDIPCVELSSSGLLILFVVVSPGGVLVVVRAGFKAAVEDADKAVGELAQRGVVAGASPAEFVVVGAGSR